MRSLIMVLVCFSQCLAFAKTSSFSGVNPNQVEVVSVDGFARMNQLHLSFVSKEGQPTFIRVAPDEGYGMLLSDIERYFVVPYRNILSAAELMGKNVTIETDHKNRVAILIEIDEE